MKPPSVEFKENECISGDLSFETYRECPGPEALIV